MKRRELITFVLLMLFTCGIYAIYWYIVFTDEVAAQLPEDKRAPSGGLVLVFTILTCGIYFIYWNYVIGTKLAEIGKNNKVAISDNGAVYLILSIFSLGLVSCILMQSDANKLA